MPTINSYRVTIVRQDGQTSTMKVLALNITDAQTQTEKALTAQTDYSSITVERDR